MSLKRVFSAPGLSLRGVGKGVKNSHHRSAIYEEPNRALSVFLPLKLYHECSQAGAKGVPQRCQHDRTGKSLTGMPPLPKHCPSSARSPRSRVKCVINVTRCAYYAGISHQHSR